ncbi:glycosyltransferase family 2 protein [Streptomyces sp. NPDC087440]|uniref:glycosyltransferase family 2 protein n=1 Tax=Streptomyces sp. NPDC087440 TaxID=3365790 RepID=UPI003803F045
MTIRKLPASGLLPQPPDDREKYSYARRHLWVLTFFAFVGVVFLAISQLTFTSSSPWFWLFAPFLVCAICHSLISLRLDGFSRGFDMRAHRALVRGWRPDTYPTVDVFLPVCGEPIEVLHNTWTHVRRMAGSYPGTVTVYVLDDGASPELAAMARDFGFRHGTRPNRGWYKKAGNLQYGFGISEGEHILILDADFAPRADLLHELLPYMDEPDTGIVQSPQFFRVLDSQNWIERGAGATQEYFYRSVQVSRDGKNASICCGSCALYRRSALEANGGTTLIEHSEDMYTGFDLRGLGWRLRYVPVALSTGVCPDTAGAYMNQQYRWCWGSLALITDRNFWNAPLRLETRLAYLSGFFYYLTTALAVFALPLIPISLLVFAPGQVVARASFLLLPTLFYVTIVQPLWHRAPFRLEAWAVQAIQGWSYVFAFWDLLRGRHMGWKPSGSSGAKQNGTRRFWLGLSLWSGGTALVWVALALWRTLDMYPPDFALLLAAGLFYAATVGRALVQPHVGEPTGAQHPAPVPAPLPAPSPSRFQKV